MTKVCVYGEVTFDMDDISNDDLVREYERRQKPSFSWVEDVYRMMGEGRIDDAMQEMQRNEPRLAPPSHERAIGDLLTGKRNG